MDTVEALKKAKIVQEEYFKYSLNQGYPVSLGDMAHVVQLYAEVDVHRIISVGYGAEHIFGRLERSEGGAEIVLSSGLNECHKRYVIIKELSHLIIDTDDSFTKDFNGLVTGLIDDSYQQIDHDDALQSENIAHYVACELLLPFKLRQGLIDSLASGDTTYYKIAKNYLIPETVVKSILHGPMHKALHVIMDKVG
ncbi:MAG: hypothetical protein KAT04_03900 [Methylococcales bacterium]|nr:hypothetical protein [Methylococcales bacterium]